KRLALPLYPKLLSKKDHHAHDDCHRYQEDRDVAQAVVRRQQPVLAALAAFKPLERIVCKRGVWPVHKPRLLYQKLEKAPVGAANPLVYDERKCEYDYDDYYRLDEFQYHGLLLPPVKPGYCF